MVVQLKLFEIINKNTDCNAAHCTVVFTVCPEMSHAGI